MTAPLRLTWPLGLLLLALVAAGCSNSNGEPQAPAAAGDAGRTVRVETLVLAPTVFEDVIELTGSVEATNDASLSAKTSGTVVSVAPLGSAVAAGQAVAQLDPGQARAAVEQAKATLAAAEAQFNLAADNFERQEPLYRDSVISAIEFENVRAQYAQAQAQVNQARAALSQAQERLSDTRVVAPFSGTVEQRFVEPGEQVMPGAPVARLVDANRVKVAVGVPERYAADIEPGTPVRVELNAYRGASRRGTVTFVGRAIDPQSRTFPVEVVLDNPDGLLKPAMVATVHIARQTIEDALVVPRSAVQRDETGTAVFVLEQTGEGLVARRRPVTVGPSYGETTVVMNLEAGDEVVVLGQNQLTDGDRVQVVEQMRSAGQAAAAAERVEE